MSSNSGQSELDKIIVGRVDPHIYAFTTQTIPNYLKIGDTVRPVFVRISEWSRKFPHLKKEKNWEWCAKIVKDQKDYYFRDYSVHKYLERTKEKKRLTKKDLEDLEREKRLSSKIPFSNEFFYDTTPNDVNEAIKDIENTLKNGTELKYDYYTYENSKRLMIDGHYPRADKEWILRDNQKAVVDKFRDAVNKGRKNLLMYAVMRFGKSFTALMCSKVKTKLCPNGAKFIVIISGKVDVCDEWQQNVEIPKNFENYVFLDAKALYNNQENKNIIKKNIKDGKTVVCFLSLQDLQGKKIKPKHDELFNMNNQIDLLIIDETHFGARAKSYGEVLKKINLENNIDEKDNEDYVDINKADEIIKTLNAKVRLHLSGTPYRILMGNEFEKQDIIACVQFSDILNEKEKWAKTNFDNEKVNEWDNPYYGFPQMVRFALNLNKSSRKKIEELKKQGISSQLSDLLKPKSIIKDSNNKHKQFVYEKEIEELLLAIDGGKKDDQLFSFINYKKIKDGCMCRHIVVVLPYKASCDAMEALILKLSKNNKFKNLQNYRILNISGVDNPSKYKKIEDIKSIIRKCEAEKQKTITLTVNRMLTGVTVKEWDTMIYMKDTTSAQEYDQAIFRLQSQYVIDNKSENNSNDFKIDMKPQTLLVDFAPSRMFNIQEYESFVYGIFDKESGNKKLEERIERALEVSPIIRFDENGINPVKATNIMDEVSNYSKNKGVIDEVNDITIDLSVLNDKAIARIIKKENELGSKAGLSFDAYEGNEANDEGEIIQNEEYNQKNNTNARANKGENSEDEKNIKKIKNYYSRILFYSYLTKSEVKSLTDILDSIKSNTENERIFTNMGLNKKIIEKMNSKMNNIALKSLDYKIMHLNKISREEIDGIVSARVALRKFGRIGNSEIVTPSKLSNKIISLLNIEDYKKIIDRDEKILDIASKEGEFAISIVEFLEKNNVNIDKIKRLIYSIPTSKIAYEFTRKIYELLGLDVKCISKNFTSYDLLNIKSINKKGKKDKKVNYELVCKILKQKTEFCNIDLSKYKATSKGDDEVKFAAIFGNPPYQEILGNNYNGTVPQSNPIYNIFVELSLKMTERFICLITPSLWMTQGTGLNEYRKNILSRKDIVSIEDYESAQEVFPNVAIAGGVSYMLFDKEYNGKVNCTYIRNNGTIRKVEVSMNQYGGDIFIRDPDAVEVLNKIGAFDEEFKSFHSIISNTYPFSNGKAGVYKNIEQKKKTKTSVKIYRYSKDKNNKFGYVAKDKIRFHKDWINKHKVYVSKAGEVSARFNGLPFYGEPNSICSETYMLIGPFASKNICENVISYMNTNLYKFLVSQIKKTQNAARSVYRFVPLVDFNKKWDNNKVNKLFKLSKKQIEYINSVVQ